MAEPTYTQEQLDKMSELVIQILVKLSERIERTGQC